MTSADEKVAVLETKVSAIQESIKSLDSRSIESGNQVTTLVGSLTHLTASVGDLTEELKSWSRASSNRLRNVEGMVAAMQAVDAERIRTQNATFNRVMAICAICAAVPTVVVFFSLRGH